MTVRGVMTEDMVRVFPVLDGIAATAAAVRAATVRASGLLSALDAPRGVAHRLRLTMTGFEGRGKLEDLHSVGPESKVLYRLEAYVPRHLTEGVVYLRREEMGTV